MDGADGVYPSSEDTFLLIDALEGDKELLKERCAEGGWCIEVGYVYTNILYPVMCPSLSNSEFVVGKQTKYFNLVNSFVLRRCGSGEVTEKLSSLLDSCACFTTDVNPMATEKTMALVEQRGLTLVNPLTCDMFAAFKETVKFDVIVFNPPYVPTDKDELIRAFVERDISASWAGGRNGREVIDRFISEVAEYLCDDGLMYLVVLEVNNPDEIILNAQRHGFTAQCIMQRQAGIEKLRVLRFRREDANIRGL